MKILIVDDHPLILHALEQVLMRWTGGSRCWAQRTGRKR